MRTRIWVGRRVVGQVNKAWGDGRKCGRGWQTQTRASGCGHGQKEMIGLHVLVTRKHQAIDKGEDEECDGGSDH